MRIILAGMAVLALMSAGSVNCFALEPGNCINSDEAELLQLVDEYRVENGLSTVPWSQSLMTVAQWHVVDAVANGATIFTGTCNMHSWSEPDSGRAPHRGARVEYLLTISAQSVHLHAELTRFCIRV
jgi:hypothetical protein